MSRNQPGSIDRVKHVWWKFIFSHTIIFSTVGSLLYLRILLFFSPAQCVLMHLKIAFSHINGEIFTLEPPYLVHKHMLGILANEDSASLTCRYWPLLFSLGNIHTYEDTRIADGDVATPCEMTLRHVIHMQRDETRFKQMMFEKHF